MSKRYPGGFIFRSNPTIVGPTNGEGGSAPGVWTLEQASYYTKLGIWPQIVIPRQLYTWGANTSGQLGQNNIISRSSPVQVGTDTNWSSLSFGSDFAIAIRSNGTIWGWGNNQQGQLGINLDVSSNPFRSSPTQIGALTNWSSVSTGESYALAVKTDGTLWSWGQDQYGQLGQNTAYSNRSSPTQIGSGTTWASVTSGDYHAVAIRTDGTMWTWGYNNFGQLGQNIATTINRSSPVQVGALTNWSKVSGGQNHTLAVKTDGTLWSWGRNNSGQLGQNIAYTINRSSPVQIGALTTWLFVGAGNYHSFAIRTNNSLWAWGSNSGGKLGDNSVDNRSSPVQIGSAFSWSSAFGGNNNSIAVTTSGTLFTWGINTSGVLGQNTDYSTASRRSSPIQVGALTTWIGVRANTNSAAGLNAPSLEKSNLWLVGRNDYSGQLAQGNLINRSSPVQVSSRNTWLTIANGCQQSTAFSLAIKTDGTLWAWGYNNQGQLGLNDLVARSVVTQVGSDTSWDKVQAGQESASAIKTNGTLWSWGRNVEGQLGDGTIIRRSSPVQIGALTNWSKVMCGVQHTIAIKTDGTLWSWGANNYGQLGQNISYLTYRSSPVQVGALTTWTSISCNNYSSFSIKTDGTLWSWGQNDFGQLGQSDTIARSSPVQVGALTNWSVISGGGTHSVAVKTDGTLWAFGRNNNGQLGQSSTINSSSPVQIGALSTWSKVGSFNNTSGAIKTDGTLWTWGLNDYGQLAQNNITNLSSPVQVGSNTNWNSVSGFGLTLAALTT